jgi:two-component system chemotaxis sensor kinase CheA
LAAFRSGTGKISRIRGKTVTEEELNERREIITDFVNESRDMLDNAEPKIIEMEKKAQASGSVDMEVLNTIFRLFHSFKGTSSFLDLSTVVSVTHEAETLLDIFRKGKAQIKSEYVDIMMRCTDFLRRILEAIDRTLFDTGFEKEAGDLINAHKEAIKKLGGPAAKSDPVKNEGQKTEAPKAAPGEIRVDISPEMVKMFVEQSFEALDEAEKCLLEIEKDPDNNDAAVRAFRALHSLKGNAGFFGYADIEQISHAEENVLDKIRNKEKKAETIIITSGLRIIDVLRDRIKSIHDGSAEEIGGKREIIRILNALSDNVPDMWAVKSKLKPRVKKDAPAADPVVPGIKFKEPEVMADKKELQPAVQAEPAAVPKNEAVPADQPGQPVKQQAIRVDVDKIDILLDLVGELVISEAMVANNPDLKGMHLERFEKAIMMHSKIIRDLQEVSMSMRMIPLAQTFQKMVRLVRDLEQKLAKRINLQIVGEETEVDKTIMEQIADPLVHLIRNAADHGIEAPADRKLAGKPEAGTVRLEAKHSSGEVLIIISDDGKGLSREKLVSKAVEKNFITEEQSGTMSDQEVFKLIFKAGFSTAEQVTNVSGRGVGMDVVVRNIEALRGKVDIRSKFGEGTSFIVHIPLTLAIIDGMVIRVGSHNYILPLNSIRDSFKAERSDVTRLPDGSEIVNVRGELLPVVRLHKLYNVEPQYTNLSDGILMKVESEDSRCLLFVDEILGQQQIVIKGLSKYLGHLRGVSGCSILGDGEISLILDVADLLKSLEMKKNKVSL